MRPSTKRLAAILVSITAVVSVIVTYTLGSAPSSHASPASLTGYYRHWEPVNSAEPAAARSYVIRRGDTLSAIAYRYVNGNWQGLYEANRRALRSGPDLIYPGTDIRLITEAGYQPPVAQPEAIIRRSRGYRAAHRPEPHHYSAASSSGGVYSFSGLEALWVSAGGPAWARWSAAMVAECESGGKPWAKNPSSPASGLWQILGLPFPGNPFDAYTNARMAVYKFKESGDTWAQWVCKP